VTDLETLIKGIRAMAREAKAGRRPTTAGITAVVEQFPWDDWHADMRDALEKPFSDVVYEQAERVAESLGKTFDRDDPFTKRRLTNYVGNLIKDLDATTKTEVVDLIRRGLDDQANQELSPAQLGDAIGDLVRDKFAGYADWRADRIARTETANAYNMGTLLLGQQSNIQRVLVSDGDQDDECAAADGQVWTLEYAMSHLTAHPNCERAFSLLEND
jgi:hypothetical protein